MSGAARVRSATFYLLALLGGCSDAPPPKKTSAELPGGAAPSPSPSSAPSAPPAAASAPSKATEGGGIRDEDFVEGPNNRDPFRSFLDEFTAQRVIGPGAKRNVLLEKFALDELTLIAVISGGDAAPRAMFRDPMGVGIVVVRGDYVSKAAAKVDKILNDRVLVQIEEQRGEDEPPAVVEREIALHAEVNP